MEHLEKLRLWLRTYPQWGDAGPLSVDFTDGQPGSAGLYSKGFEELSRVADVTGRTVACCRWNFLLYRLEHQQEDNEKNASWLMGFQQWVQQQSAAGLAPAFGEDPARERISARNGRLEKTNAAGTVRYSVELTVEFITYYDPAGREEIGKN